MHTPADGVPGYILHPLDNEALLAVYGSLNYGDSPTEIAYYLGSWSDETIHLRGDLDAIPGTAFGVAHRNGLSQPWAIGPSPWTNIADNNQLIGTAIWSGSLLGLARPGLDKVVSGAADLAVDLHTLDGQLDFTNLKSTDPLVGQEPEMWRDGDLNYEIIIRDNTFVDIDGDAGSVTGTFFGPAHEGMGGTLKRIDLTAAFGGTRK